MQAIGDPETEGCISENLDTFRSVSEDAARILTNEDIIALQAVLLRAVSLLNQHELDGTPSLAASPCDNEILTFLLKGVTAAMSSRYVAPWNMVWSPSRVSYLRTPDMLHAAVPQTLFDGVFGVFTIQSQHSAEQYQPMASTQPLSMGSPPRFVLRMTSVLVTHDMPYNRLNVTWKQSTFSPTPVLVPSFPYIQSIDWLSTILGLGGAPFYLMSHFAVSHTEYVRK